MPYQITLCFYRYCFDLNQRPVKAFKPKFPTVITRNTLPELPESSGWRTYLHQVLKEHGYDVFESDKGNKDDSLILESHKAEKHRWYVESWSLFKCISSEKSLDLEDVKGFYELVLSDHSERGYIITTGSFTEDALRFLKDKPIEIIDEKGFLDLVRKASTPQSYCIECLSLRVSVHPFNLMFGDIIRKILSLFNTISERDKKRLETILDTNVKNLASSIVKIERESLNHSREWLENFLKKKNEMIVGTVHEPPLQLPVNLLSQRLSSGTPASWPMIFYQPLHYIPEGS